MKIKIKAIMSLDPMMAPLKETLAKLENQDKVIWAYKVAAHVLPYSMFQDKLQELLDSSIKFLEGKRSLFAVRLMSYKAKRIASKTFDPVGKSVAKSVQHAIGTIDKLDSAINSSIYALDAVYQKDGYPAALNELNYQFKLFVPIIQNREKENKAKNL